MFRKLADTRSKCQGHWSSSKHTRVFLLTRSFLITSMEWAVLFYLHPPQPQTVWPKFRDKGSSIALHAEGSRFHPHHFHVQLGKIPFWNPGEPLPLRIENSELDGPMVWLCTRQHPILSVAIPYIFLHMQWFAPTTVNMELTIRGYVCF